MKRSYLLMLSFVICCFFFSMIGSKYLVLASDLKEKSIELVNNASDMELDIYELEENIEKSDKSLTDTIVRIADIDTAVKMPVTGKINCYDSSKSWLFDESLFFKTYTGTVTWKGSYTRSITGFYYYMIPKCVGSTNFLKFARSNAYYVKEENAGYIVLYYVQQMFNNISDSDLEKIANNMSYDSSFFDNYIWEKIEEPTPEPTQEPTPEPTQEPTPEPKIEEGLTMRYDNHMDMIIFAFGVLIGVLSGGFVWRFVK